jgi:putative membrane protein
MITEPQHSDESALPGQPIGPAVPDTMVPPAGPVLPEHTLKRTRTSGAWTTVACFAVVLLLLLIFILQNSRTVEVGYFGAHGHLPLGVALLLAAVAGILLIALPGGARILQLRAIARRHRRADARHAAHAPAGPGDHPDLPISPDR